VYIITDKIEIVVAWDTIPYSIEIC